MTDCEWCGRGYWNIRHWWTLLWLLSRLFDGDGIDGMPKWACSWKARATAELNAERRVG